MPVIGLSMTLRYLHPLRFILPIVSCDSKLSIRRWRLHFRHEDATTDDSHTKAMRSLTGSLTYYSSIVAIINQHHISSSRPFIQAKREKKKKKKPTTEDRSRISPMQMKSNYSSVCRRACTLAELHLCVLRNPWTTTKDTQVWNRYEVYVCRHVPRDEIAASAVRGSPPISNTLAEWYWLRKWGHRMWFHCTAMVHRSLIALQRREPRPRLANAFQIPRTRR